MKPTDVVPGHRRSLITKYVDQLRLMNRGVNLVSRTSADRILEDHVEHCLALASRPFPSGSRIVDWGSGGGLPAIPLAICFPDVEFVAVDSVAKKTNAIRIMARRLGLDNVTVWNGRAESWSGSFLGAVSRATAPLESLWAWTVPFLDAGLAEVALEAGPPAESPAESPAEPPPGSQSGLQSDSDGSTTRATDVVGPGSGTHGVPPWPSGLVCLKGGDLTDEIRHLQDAFPATVVEVQPLTNLFQRPDWETKYIVTVIQHSRITEPGS